MYKISVQSKLRTIHFFRFHSLWVSISSHSILFAKGRLVSRLLCGFKVTRHLLDIYSQESEYFYIKKRWKSWRWKVSFFSERHIKRFSIKNILWKKYIKLFVTLLSGFILFRPLAKKSDPVCINLLSHLWSIMIKSELTKMCKKKNLSRFLELQLSC